MSPTVFCALEILKRIYLGIKVHSGIIEYIRGPTFSNNDKKHRG